MTNIQINVNFASQRRDFRLQIIQENYFSCSLATKGDQNRLQGWRVPDLVLSSTAPCSRASPARRFWPWGSCGCESRRRQPATPSAAAPSSAWATECGCLHDSIQSHFLPEERLPETLVTLSEKFPTHTDSTPESINKIHPEEFLPNSIKFNLPIW